MPVYGPDVTHLLAGRKIEERATERTKNTTIPKPRRKEDEEEGEEE